MGDKDKQKYFWLKLKDDFFNSDDIKIIQKQENGSDYIIFWQKLLLKAITSKEIGILRYKEKIPYTPDILATVTDTNIDIVKGALTLFNKLNMIDINSKGDIIIDELIHDLIGVETHSALRKRNYRKRIEKRDSVPKVSQNSPLEIEKEIEKKKELDIKKELKKKQSVYEIPDFLNTNEFMQVWDTWVESRKQQRKKLTILAATGQLKMLEEYDVQTAIDVLNNSIRNDYQGLFPPKDGKPKQHKYNCTYCKKETTHDKLSTGWICSECHKKNVEV